MAQKRPSALGPAARGAAGGILDELLTDETPRRPAKRRRPERTPKARRLNSRPPATGTVRTSVDLPEDLHERLKIASVRSHTTMRAALLEAVVAWLEDREP